MTWTLNSSNLPNTNTLLLRRRGLELLELGTTNYRSPLFKVNPLASFGFGNTEIPKLEDGQTGYEPVTDTEFILTPEAEIFCYVLDENYSVDTFNQIFSFSSIASNTYLFANNKTYVFTVNTTIDTEINLELIVPTFTGDYLFNFDLSSYELDSVDLADIKGLQFVPNFNNNIATIQASANCRPFAGDTAILTGSKQFTSTNSTKLNGLVFDITPLNLGYVDKVDFQNRSYEFSPFPQDGGLTYNSSTKKLYLWL